MATDHSLKLHLYFVCFIGYIRVFLECNDDGGDDVTDLTGWCHLILKLELIFVVLDPIS